MQCLNGRHVRNDQHRAEENRNGVQQAIGTSVREGRGGTGAGGRQSDLLLFTRKKAANGFADAFNTVDGPAGHIFPDIQRFLTRVQSALSNGFGAIGHQCSRLSHRCHDCLEDGLDNLAHRLNGLDGFAGLAQVGHVDGREGDFQAVAAGDG